VGYPARKDEVGAEGGRRQAGAGASLTKQHSPTAPRQGEKGRSSEGNRAQPRIQ